MPKYKFDQIAYNINDKKMPEPGDEEMYIGLEHLDSGSLRVTRWGSDVPIKGQKLLMKKGDILFGRRNTYLRRAAIAPHDGIFSAHGMIFRPKTEVIDEKYFPFFIASDYFMDEAIRISVGSLSPTVNWKTLKELEFVIPELDEQKRLAEILTAADETRESYKKLLAKTDELVKSQFIEMFGDPEHNTKGFEIKYLPDISNNLDNRRVPITSGDRTKGEYPYYGASGITDYVSEYIYDEDILLVSEDGANLTARVTPIAFSVSGKCWVNNHAHVLSFESEEMQTYVEHLINMHSLNGLVTGSAQPKLSQANLNRIEIPMPSDGLIKKYSMLIKQSDKSKFEIKQAIDSLNATIRALVQRDN